MRSAVIVTGILGAGSALVFALAIAVSAMFPNGGSIVANVNQVFMGAGGAMAVPVRGFAVPVQVPTPVLDPPTSDPGSPSPAASPSG